MVCVKLPKTVLVLFHLFRATKLPIFPGIDHPLNRVSSWRSVVRFALDKAASYRRMSSSDSARCLIRIGPRGTSTPNLPRRANHPRVGTGVRRSKSKGGVPKSFCYCWLASSCKVWPSLKRGWPLNCSPQTGVWGRAPISSALCAALLNFLS